METTEEWRAVIDWPYEVSNMGRVRNIGGRIKKATIATVGYPVVNLSRGGHDRQKVVYVHRLVCVAFHGDPPTINHQVAHFDGVKTNNSATNLRWATGKENIADNDRHGVLVRGSKSPMTHLTEVDVASIRAAYYRGDNPKLIASKYGVRKKNIRTICSGKTWAHAGGPIGRPKENNFYRGEHCQHSKLRECDVVEIRQMIEAGDRRVAIARRFNVSPSLIGAIKLRKCWAHIP